MIKLYREENSAAVEAIEAEFCNPVLGCDREVIDRSCSIVRRGDLPARHHE